MPNSPLFCLLFLHHFLDRVDCQVRVTNCIKTLENYTMQIFVGSTAYEVDAATSVEALKLQIENAEFIPSHQICLMNGANVLEEGSLESNGVEGDDSLEMRMAVTSGMRKKWKKKRMRRLRRKRRKMRQRAR